MSGHKRWWSEWMKRIRWSENPNKFYAKHVFSQVADIKNPPTCKCGATMECRAGYEMGGDGDWLAYSCPNDRPWDYWRHSPWTTQTKAKPA